MVAWDFPATRSAKLNGVRCPVRSGPSPFRAQSWLGRVVAAVAAAVLAASSAEAQKVRLTGLTDVDFGTVTNLGVDAVRSQSVCLFSGSATNGYNITATGSGAANAFTLANGSNTLSYDVQWNAAAGQSSGTLLSPNVALTGLISPASQQTCNSGPPTSASLIVALRSADLSSAIAGAYGGSLTLIVAPE